ncbi:hypothetical protein [Cryobacterium sp. CG_9.6]|uniref:hypothetical protein n=1 Tax=Cryobacterium sp. CG_9.6 TaxID=2760710 RepID=UPI002474290F|nr:hypothetical protein [Cryobacterium sp. CG_9.6]MDH6238172.1 hypothetical protein [Cryobacterium sp. CG_9.6]
MTHANPDLTVVLFYSSDDFITSVKELTGIALASSALPSGAFLVFVDGGKNFELWRWHRHGPERVVRLAWSDVRSVDVGQFTHLVMTDRAVILTLKVGASTVPIPISPQARGRLRLRPLNDEGFTTVLAHCQKQMRAAQMLPRSVPIAKRESGSG